MGPWNGFLVLGAGGCLVFGFIHLMIAGRLSTPRLHFWLSALAFTSAAKALSEVNMYLALTPEAYGQAMKIQLAVSGLWGITLAWFLAAYIGGLKRLATGVTVVWGLAVAVDLASANGLAFSEITNLRFIDFPWGETITLGEGPAYPLRFLVELTGMALAVLAVAACTVTIRRGERRKAVPLVLGLGTILVAGFVYAPFVDAGRIHLPYLVTPAIFFLVLVMGYDLATRVVETFQLSRAVVANEHRWRSLLDEVDLLITAVDCEGRIEMINPHFSRVLGYSDREVTGRNIADLVPESERERLRIRFSERLDGGIAQSIETPVVTADGAARTIFWSSVVLRDSDGTVTGMLSVGADLTDRHRAEKARDEALREVERLRDQLELENLYLKEEIRSDHDFKEIVGNSDALKKVLSSVQQVSATDTTVIIQGETGVGKELIARAIHDRSGRARRPFIRVNCAALPPSLAESELFGHEAGAFTGARGLRKGRFEVADGGTIFLDEIGELAPELQPKLLRVLQSGEIERVGSSATRVVDVRVLAATNRDLSREVRAGRFREDLFYRLDVYPVTVPPLRERRDDIELLVRHYVPKIAARVGRTIEEIPGSVLQRLHDYGWPGNVRELLNVLERAVITSPGPGLRLADSLVSQAAAADAPSPDRNLPLEEVERRHILAVLESTGWRISGENGAAEILGLNPSTLRGRMRKHDLKR